MIERKGDGLPIEKPTLEGGPNFAALGGMAAEVDAQAHEALNPGAAQAAAEAAANGPDYGRSAAGIVELASAALDGYAPGAGWAPEQQAKMAGAIAPVLEKYGWDLEGKVPCELVAALVCGPALYNSAKIVAMKITSDRIQIERAARGLNDPNTIKGAAAAESGPPSVPPGIGDVSAPENLGAAVSGLPNFPDM